MRIIASLLLTLALSGCALFQKAPITDTQLAVCKSAPATLAAACNEAVDILEKSDILLASVNDAIDQAFTSKLISKEDALALRAKTKKADVELDRVVDALNKLDFTQALTQANVTKLLIEALNREVAAQVAKGAK